MLQIFATGQSISVSVQTSNGYGTPQNDLNDGQRDRILKVRAYPHRIFPMASDHDQSDYAAAILFYCSIACSKFAISTFIHSLTPRKLHHQINYGCVAFVGLWLLTSILVSAFRCAPPSPWRSITSLRCIDYVRSSNRQSERY